MDTNNLYNRELLFPTENIYEPGCVYIELLKPDKSSKIPIVIESKTGHSPVKYINAIIRIMQSDILDRIFVDIKKNVNLYILNTNNNKDFPEKKFIKVDFVDDETKFEGVDEVSI